MKGFVVAALMGVSCLAFGQQEGVVSSSSVTTVQPGGMDPCLNYGTPDLVQACERGRLNTVPIRGPIPVAGPNTTVVQTTAPSTSMMPAWQQSLQPPVTTTTKITTPNEPIWQQALQPPPTKSTTVTTVQTTNPSSGTVVNTMPVTTTTVSPQTTTTEQTTITPAR